MARSSKRKSNAEQLNEDLMDLVPKKPLEIVGITVDSKNNFYGLGNNGMLYKYHIDSREWVLL